MPSFFEKALLISYRKWLFGHHRTPHRHLPLLRKLYLLAGTGSSLCQRGVLTLEHWMQQAAFLQTKCAFGAVDTATLVQERGEPTLLIRGWIFAPESKVRLLAATIDGVHSPSIRRNLPRDDVRDAFPGEAHSFRCGFELSMKRPQILRKFVDILVEVTLTDGRAVAFSVPGVTVEGWEPPETTKRSHSSPPQSLLFEHFEGRGAPISFIEADIPECIVVMLPPVTGSSALATIVSLYLWSEVSLRGFIMDDLPEATSEIPRLLAKVSGIQRLPLVNPEASIREALVGPVSDYVLLVQSSHTILPGTIPDALALLRTSPDLSSVKLPTAEGFAMLVRSDMIETGADVMREAESTTV